MIATLVRSTQWVIVIMVSVVVIMVSKLMIQVRVLIIMICERTRVMSCAYLLSASASFGWACFRVSAYNMIILVNISAVCLDMCSAFGIVLGMREIMMRAIMIEVGMLTIVVIN